MKIISFVVPAYNSEKFLEKCVNSLVHKDFSDKIEVIIVNDGSTDKTAQIAEKLCAEWPDSVRLINQENRGHGGALNTGCAAATGKYLKVVDADDTVETENLSEFIPLLETCESDVVLTHYRTINVCDGKITEWRSFPKAFCEAITFDDIMTDFKAFDKTFTFHGITYKNDFYKTEATPLLEKVFYEDHEFSTFPAAAAKTITFFDIFIYLYRIGDVTQSVSEENQLRRISHIEGVLAQLAKKYAVIKARADLSAAEFVVAKTAILLLSGLTTLLLSSKNRKEGRAQAEKLINNMGNLMPEAVLAVKRKYTVLKALGSLHISKKTFDKILSSGIYKTLIQKK